VTEVLCTVCSVLKPLRTLLPAHVPRDVRIVLSASQIRHRRRATIDIQTGQNVGFHTSGRVYSRVFTSQSVRISTKFAIGSTETLCKTPYKLNIPDKTGRQARTSKNCSSALLLVFAMRSTRTLLETLGFAHLSVRKCQEIHLGNRNISVDQVLNHRGNTGLSAILSPSCQKTDYRCSTLFLTVMGGISLTLGGFTGVSAPF